MNYPYVIIGAGPTGLGAAWRLKELGEDDFIVIEATDRVGGLATTFADENGFLWDIGGHVQFSHYDYFDVVMEQALGRDGWLQHQRESWVWIRDRFVPYPFQNNVRHLPEDDLWKCLAGVIDIYQTPRPEPTNFHEWIEATFGSGIAEIFMIPYNFKVWAYPPAELSCSWIGDRVSVVDLKRVISNVIFEKDDVSWGPNNHFRFPKKGGTGAIWKNVAAQIGMDKFIMQNGVRAIEGDSKKIVLSDGTEVFYDQLLSTMPLDQLLRAVNELPKNVKHLASELKYSSSNIVGLGLAGKPKQELATKCWMYFPESNCPFYRVTLFSNYSPYNVPDINRHWSLMTETSESPAKPVNQRDIIEETIQGALNADLIKSREEIISTWHYRAEYGYPTPFLERDEILQRIMPFLDNFDIESRGRFGAWKYEISNQDHSMMQGVEWVNKKKLKVPELTFNFPETANANWGKQ